MFFKILDKSKKNNFLNNVKDFGIGKIDELLIKSGSERIRAYSGNLSKKEIADFINLLPVEAIGLYVGKEIKNKKTNKNETRISLEGASLWKKQIDKKIILVDHEQEEFWFKGGDIEVKEKQIKDICEGFVVLKSLDAEDLIGVGKLNKEGTVFNFLPKERRRKN